MSTFKIFKDAAVPSSFGPNEIHIVAAAGEYAEIYVSDNQGTAMRRLPTTADIASIVYDAFWTTVFPLLPNSNELMIVPDIAFRNSLDLTHSIFVYVEDATGDPTVSSGGATYLCKSTVSGWEWIKTSEAESLDVQLNWSAIVGKPSSSPAQIDAAVASAHSHANKASLDKIGEDGSGQMTYGGAVVGTTWSTTNW